MDFNNSLDAISGPTSIARVIPLDNASCPLKHPSLSLISKDSGSYRYQIHSFSIVLTLSLCILIVATDVRSIKYCALGGSLTGALHLFIGVSCEGYLS